MREAPFVWALQLSALLATQDRPSQSNASPEVLADGRIQVIKGLILAVTHSLLNPASSVK